MTTDPREVLESGDVDALHRRLADPHPRRPDQRCDRRRRTPPLRKPIDLDDVGVTAHGAQQFSSDIATLGDYDAVVVTLRGARGELITIISSRHSAYGYDQRTEVFGAAGLLQVGSVGPTIVRAYGAESVEGIAPHHTFFLQRYAEGISVNVDLNA